MCGRDRYSQRKRRIMQTVFRFCQTVFPSAAACSHLVVSIHLHSLIITDQGLSFFFLHSFPFLPLQLWPGRSLHNSTCVATQKVRPKFCRNSVQPVLGFPRVWGNEKRRKRERLCAIRREKAVWKHTSGERNLIYYHQKSAADVSSQILPLPPIIDTHATICSTPVCLFTQTHTDLYYLIHTCA